MKLDTNEVKIVPQIIEFFGIPELVTVEIAKSGISNHNYYVKARDNSEYFVKFLINQPEESIQNDIYIQNQLKKVGIVTPFYISNNNGDVVYNQNNIRAVVSKKIEGETSYEVNNQLVIQFGKVLALFHQNVKRLPYSNIKGLINRNVCKIQSSLFTKNLPKGIVHGDFHSGNALVDTKTKSKIVAILDFEEAGENILLIDLALTAMAVCSKENDSIDIDCINYCLSGYQSIRKLTSIEIENFEEAINYSAGAWINWFNKNGFDKYAKRHQSKLKSFKKQKNQLVFDM